MLPRGGDNVAHRHTASHSQQTSRQPKLLEGAILEISDGWLADVHAEHSIRHTLNVTYVHNGISQPVPHRELIEGEERLNAPSTYRET